MLAFFRSDVSKEGDVPFIRGRGTRRVLKRTGREWEPSRIYGKWVDSHFKGLVGWVGLRWLVLVKTDCKRPLYRLNVPTGGVYGLPAQWGSLVVLQSKGLWMVLPEAWRRLLAVLLGRCPRSLFSFYMVVLCSLSRTEDPFRRRGVCFYTLQSAIIESPSGLLMYRVDVESLCLSSELYLCNMHGSSDEWICKSDRP